MSFGGMSLGLGFQPRVWLIVPGHIAVMADEIIRRRRYACRWSLMPDIDDTNRRLDDEDRSVLADWIEEQGNKPAAKSVRENLYECSYVLDELSAFRPPQTGSDGR